MKINSKTEVVQSKYNMIQRFFRKKSKITLGHPKFDAAFNVYSQNRNEALSILTNRMIDRLLFLENKWTGRIFLSFRDNHPFIAIHNDQDLFEVDLDKEVNMNQVERIYKEIEMCLEIIDLLNVHAPTQEINQ